MSIIITFVRILSNINEILCQYILYYFSETTCFNYNQARGKLSQCKLSRGDSSRGVLSRGELSRGKLSPALLGVPCWENEGCNEFNIN